MIRTLCLLLAFALLVANAEPARQVGWLSTNAEPARQVGWLSTNAEPARQVGWFTNRGLLDYNWKFTQANRDIVQKIYPCCMAFQVSDTGDVFQYDNDNFITMYTQSYKQIGIGVYPVITCHVSSYMEKAYTKVNIIANKLYTIAYRLNLTGFVFDYEGNAQDSVKYGQFLDTIGKYFKSAPPVSGSIVQLYMTVASWGNLRDYTAYGNKSIDGLIQMGTYSPPFQPVLMDELAAAAPAAKIVMGLSTFHDAPTYTWDCPQLQYAISYGIWKGTSQLGIWWAPNSPEEGSIQPFFLQQLRNFLTVSC